MTVDGCPAMLRLFAVAQVIAMATGAALAGLSVSATGLLVGDCVSVGREYGDIWARLSVVSKDDDIVKGG